MRLIVPTLPTLVSTNVAASAKTEWSAATTYAQGATVKYAANQPVPHHEFESLQAANINQPPVIGGNDWWLDLGATNQHRMFDDRNASRTVATDGSNGIVVSIRPPTRTGVVALLNMKGVRSARIVQAYGGQTKSDETIQLLTTDSPVGLWTYFFGEYRVTTSTVRPIPGAWYQPTITIALEPESASVPAEIGTCFLGQAFELGNTETGMQTGLIDYSTFEKDEFGDYVLIPRINVREGTLTVWADTAQFDRIYSLFEAVIGRLVLIDGNNGDSNFDSARIYGKITSMRAGLRYATTPIDIQIEGIA